MTDADLHLPLETTETAGVRTLWLNRPALHNAFDAELIDQLTVAVVAAGADPAVRVLVIGGRGPSFCAGGDLHWMLRAAQYTHAQNLADANRLAGLFHAVYTSPKPVVARVHGNALAGGTGLVAACDVVVADSTAKFGTPEVRIGLVPGTIGPYVVNAIGARAASRYFLTGERFDAAEAHRLGLVHVLCAPNALDAAVENIVRALLAGGPHALQESKGLLQHLAARAIDAPLVAETAEWIARVRSTPEGHEGIGAFLAKRLPNWRA